MKSWEEILACANPVSKLEAKFVFGLDTDYENCLGWLGGDSSNPTWEQYLREFPPQVVDYLIALRECVEREDLVGLCGDEAQTGTFLFNSGISLGLSYRAWGDFMQALVGRQEGYMTYYMRYSNDTEPPHGYLRSKAQTQISS